jgi:hypothetical protein
MSLKSFNNIFIFENLSFHPSVYTQKYIEKTNKRFSIILNLSLDCAGRKTNQHKYKKYIVKMMTD